MSGAYLTIANILNQPVEVKFIYGSHDSKCLPTSLSLLYTLLQHAFEAGIIINLLLKIQNCTQEDIGLLSCRRCSIWPLKSHAHTTAIN